MGVKSRAAPIKTPSPPQAQFAANSEITARPKGKPRGRPWKRGQSGNPKGRPKDVYKIAEMARKFSEECLRELAKLMRSDDGTVPPQAKIAAINSILDRGLGKPMQPTQQQQLDAEGKPVTPTFTVNVGPYPEPPTAPETASRAKDTRH